MRRRVVGELMNPDVVCLTPNTSLREAMKTLSGRSVGGAPVVDGQGHVLGVVSQNDLVRHESKRTTAADSGRFFTSVDDYRDLAQVPVHDEDTTPVSEVMTRQFHHVSRKTGVAIAANIMRERRIHRLLVIDQGVLVGVITSFDLLRVVEEAC